MFYNQVDNERRSEDRLAHKRMDAVESRMGKVEILVAKNNADTAEILEIIRAGKGFFKVMGILATILKWIIGIGAAVGGLYAAWHSKG